MITFSITIPNNWLDKISLVFKGAQSNNRKIKWECYLLIRAFFVLRWSLLTSTTLDYFWLCHSDLEFDIDLYLQGHLKIIQWFWFETKFEIQVQFPALNVSDVKNVVSYCNKLTWPWNNLKGRRWGQIQGNHQIVRNKSK